MAFAKEIEVDATVVKVNRGRAQARKLKVNANRSLTGRRQESRICLGHHSERKHNSVTSGQLRMCLPARQPFQLELSWLRSHAFRWIEWHGRYYGVIDCQAVKVRQSVDGVEFHRNASEGCPQALVQAYFRLDQNMRPVHDALRQVDATMSGLVERYGAMRLLRQDPWECLVSYICSQNNNIDRIAQIVNRLVGKYKAPLELDGVKFRSLPTPHNFLEVGEIELDDLNLGLGRGSLIWTVAKDVS